MVGDISVKVAGSMEKHTIAMTFLRKAMKVIDRVLKPKADILSQEDIQALQLELQEEINKEIMALLDDLLQRERL